MTISNRLKSMMAWLGLLCLACALFNSACAIDEDSSNDRRWKWMFGREMIAGHEHARLGRKGEMACRLSPGIGRAKHKSSAKEIKNGPV